MRRKWRRKSLWFGCWLESGRKARLWWAVMRWKLICAQFGVRRKHRRCIKCARWVNRRHAIDPTGLCPNPEWEIPPDRFWSLAQSGLGGVCGQGWAGFPQIGNAAAKSWKLVIKEMAAFYRWITSHQLVTTQQRGVANRDIHHGPVDTYPQPKLTTTDLSTLNRTDSSTLDTMRFVHTI